MKQQGEQRALTHGFYQERGAFELYHAKEKHNKS